MSRSVPDSAAALRERILGEYEQLSHRLQQIARFALDHPNDIALETIAVIADRAAVQPSAVIRFAKAFGYRGFSDMQRVFQARLAEQAPSYSERIRHLREARRKDGDPTTWEVLRELCAVNTVSLEHLPDVVAPETLERAVGLLARARIIHVCGQRRSYPVVAYLAYVFSRVNRYTHLLDGAGGMLLEQARGLVPDDVLVAVSFHPYASETAEVVARAAYGGCPVVVITDSPLSPIAAHADVRFEVHDAELHDFRSLTASLCLAQALAVGLGLDLERDQAR